MPRPRAQFLVQVALRENAGNSPDGPAGDCICFAGHYDSHFHRNDAEVCLEAFFVKQLLDIADLPPPIRAGNPDQLFCAQDDACLEEPPHPARWCLACPDYAGRFPLDKRATKNWNAIAVGAIWRALARRGWAFDSEIR